MRIPMQVWFKSKSNTNILKYTKSVLRVFIGVLTPVFTTATLGRIYSYFSFNKETSLTSVGVATGLFLGLLIEYLADKLGEEGYEGLFKKGVRTYISVIVVVPVTMVILCKALRIILFVITYAMANPILVLSVLIIYLAVVDSYDYYASKK